MIIQNIVLVIYILKHVQASKYYTDHKSNLGNQWEDGNGFVWANFRCWILMSSIKFVCLIFSPNRVKNLQICQFCPLLWPFMSEPFISRPMYMKQKMIIFRIFYCISYSLGNFSLEGIETKAKSWATSTLFKYLIYHNLFSNVRLVDFFSLIKVKPYKIKSFTQVYSWALRFF